MPPAKAAGDAPAPAVSYAHLMFPGARAEDPQAPPPDPEAEGEPEDVEAEDDQPAPEAEDPETPPDPEAEDGQDPPEEMTGKSGAAQARARERARCAAIFGCKAAGANPALAAHLAFNTALPRGAAIAALKAGAVGVPTARTGGLAARMGAQPRAALGMTAPATSEQSVMQGWGSAFAKAAGTIKR